MSSKPKFVSLAGGDVVHDDCHNSLEEKFISFIKLFSDAWSDCSN